MATEEIHDAKRLEELQALPLNRKILISQARIIEWYQHWKGRVFVSFSGGKDSTVLLHLCRQIYPDIKAVFFNTGLEYPEIRNFVKEQDNVDIVRPYLRFDEVITRYGYPVVSKETAEAIALSRRLDCDTSSTRRQRLLGNERSNNNTYSKYNMKKWYPLTSLLPAKVSAYCCNVMKKRPSREYQKFNRLYPIIGTLAEESTIRRMAWISGGCNIYSGEHCASKPLSFWTNQDILQYLSINQLSIASVYGDIIRDGDGAYSTTKSDRTGCIFCGFGAHLERVSRFQRLQDTHPKQYEFCINGGQWIDNNDYDPDASEYNGEWKNWNPKKIWVPSRDGLGMGKLFDMVNDIYGKEMIKYK